MGRIVPRSARARSARPTTVVTAARRVTAPAMGATAVGAHHAVRSPLCSICFTCRSGIVTIVASCISAISTAIRPSVATRATAAATTPAPGTAAARAETLAAVIRGSTAAEVDAVAAPPTMGRVPTRHTGRRRSLKSPALGTNRRCPGSPEPTGQPDASWTAPLYSTYKPEAQARESIATKSTRLRFGLVSVHSLALRACICPLACASGLYLSHFL